MTLIASLRGVNDGQQRPSNALWQESLFIAAVGRGNHDMWTLENRADIEKIKAMLFEV